MISYNILPDRSVIDKTIEALKANGIKAIFAGSADEARQMLFDMIPVNSQVMTMVSVTLDQLGITGEINESGKYDSSKKKLRSKDPAPSKKEASILGATSDYSIGSVHAITQNGEILIASNTGSQLGAYAYPSPHVIWIAGAQKIVASRDDGFRRIYDYCFPLENARAKQAYGTNSNVSKILIINKELSKGRLNLIIVNEVIGY